MGQAPDDGDSGGWGAVIRPLVHLSRVHDVALLVLHHVRRSDGEYRSSGEIAAAVDCVLTMKVPANEEDPTLRRFSGRARWPVEEFSVRMEQGGYVLGAGGPIPLEARVVMDTSGNPGTSRTAQHKRLGGRKATYVAAVNRLLETGGVVERAGKLYVEGDAEGEMPF